MSVLMTMRVRGNPKSVEDEDKAFMQSIAEKGKQHGVISHHFYGTDDEVLVLDEWPDVESFHQFFADAPEIQGVVERSGATAEPSVTMWHHLDLGDDIDAVGPTAGVLMTMRAHGDPKSLENEDRGFMRSITEKGKQHGVISHHIYGTDDEVLVLDEWPDEESFHQFFADAPEIQGIIERAGATAPPEVSFWHHLDVGDDID